MLTNVLPTDVRSLAPLPSRDERSRFGHLQKAYRDEEHVQGRANGGDATVQVSPAEAVKRRAVALDGMRAEIVHASRAERIEYRFRSSLHMLAVYEHGVRSTGDTFVE